MNNSKKIEKLREFKSLLDNWSSVQNAAARSEINQKSELARRITIDAKCWSTITIIGPPILGSQKIVIDPFTAIFEDFHGRSVISDVIDMIDRAIGVLDSEQFESLLKPTVVEKDHVTQKDFMFVAMPISAESAHSADVLDAIKQVAICFNIKAERIDENESNEKITDRILECIEKAQYVICDLSLSRPNVFYEAGYAQGINKTPIFIAQSGTDMHFDLKDYPIIFFDGMVDLKRKLEQRLRTIAN